MVLCIRWTLSLRPVWALCCLFNLLIVQAVLFVLVALSSWMCAKTFQCPKGKDINQHLDIGCRKPEPRAAAFKVYKHISFRCFRWALLFAPSALSSGGDSQLRTGLFVCLWQFCRTSEQKLFSPPEPGTFLGKQLQKSGHQIYAQAPSKLTLVTWSRPEENAEMALLVFLVSREDCSQHPRSVLN